MPQLPESDLLLSLSNLALRKACTAVADLRKRGHKDVVVAVNLSSVQLQNPLFVDQISMMIADFGVSASSFTLEITESVVMGRHGERVTKVLDDLHSKGFN